MQLLPPNGGSRARLRAALGARSAAGQSRVAFGLALSGGLPALRPQARKSCPGWLCRCLPVKHVAQLMGLHRHTVKAIDKAHLHETLGPPDLSGVDVIAMDEFSIHKGHRYATVIVDPRCKRVLWIGRAAAAGRSVLL